MGQAKQRGTRKERVQQAQENRDQSPRSVGVNGSPAAHGSRSNAEVAANSRALTSDVAAAQNVVANLRQALAGSASMVELAQLTNVVADILVEPANVASTCTLGCSHCCKQSSIMIDQADAELLSLASGRKMDIPNYRESLNLKGVPCVFLDESSNSCTVYEYRPMTCRISISHDDPMKCKTEEFRQMVALEPVLFDVIRLVGPQHTAAYKRARGQLNAADIRQFFRPPTLS